jgi:hypothetical protein
MSEFARGARVRGAREEVEVDISGLIDSAVLFENAVRSTNRGPDLIGKGCFLGTPFRVTGVRRTSRNGRPMLKLFFEPLKTEG